MKPTYLGTRAVAAFACLVVIVLAGCHNSYDRQAPAPLGTLSDPIWQNQELNAEMSDFVIYQHEFERGTQWLTTDGEDHVKQIASRLLSGQEAQVVVERSMTSARADTTYGYPVHPNPELDLERREIIVRSLLAMGLQNADEIVLVAPAFAQGITGNEAEAAYYEGLRGVGSDSGHGGWGNAGGGIF